MPRHHAFVASMLLSALPAAAQEPAPWPVPAPGPETVRYIELRQANYRESGVGEAMNALGGIRTGHGELFADEAQTDRRGTTLLTCGNTAVEDGRGLSQICNGVFRLADGSLFWQSSVTAEDRAQRRIHFVVTGGTGAYAGARGHGVNRFHTRPTFQHIYLLSVTPAAPIPQSPRGG
jgi:hypothetical protein